MFVPMCHNDITPRRDDLVRADDETPAPDP